MDTVLDTAFFRRPVLTVAEELIGKHLVVRGAPHMITEAEAYDGPKDRACHAAKGLTARTAPMFGPAGHWYVYLCYGMYWMLNIVTGDEGYPAAVLIRGIRGHSGPGKLTRALGINGQFNALPAIHRTGLWIEDHGTAIDPARVRRTPRIGVAYAGEWAAKPYRFVLE